VKINNRDSTISETLQLFLSTISSTLHDARKYALIVGGFVELLQRELAGPLNEEQRELVRESLHRAKMLFHILDQALMLSSIDLYPRSPEPLEYNVVDIVQEAIQIAANRNKPKSDTIRIERFIEPLQVFADRDDIVHILRQVLDNAIKYTREQGKITVTAREQQDMITITLQDTGSGIRAEQQERLFQRLSGHYQHIPNELSSSGVGLAIAHALAQRNNGRIELTSTSNEGSIFSIILPKNKSVA